MKKIIIFLLMLVLLCVPSFASIDNIPNNHWAYPLAKSLEDNEILRDTDNATIGEPIIYNDFINLLNRCSNITTFDFNTDRTANITREEALITIVSALGYDYLAQQLVDTSIDFTDVTQNKGYYVLALDFGIINKSDQGIFRPNDHLKYEEALALIYHVDRLSNLKAKNLMGYYAISSNSQIKLTGEMDTVFFGWSRLEYNKDLDEIYLNTKSENNNEYRFPTGYSEVLSEIDSKKYLMIAMQNTLITDEANNYKTIENLVLSDVRYMDKTISEIIETLNSHSEFDGVLIDFEGLKTSETAEKFNTFLSRLKVETDKKGYNIAVAVHPVRSEGIAYYDGYDYKTIGHYSDLVVLMAHDYYAKKLTDQEMASGISITPLTPINEIYVALKAISDPISGVEDQSKIVLQFSIDSAQWKIKEGQIINETPYHPTYRAITSRIDEGFVPIYSSDLKNPYLVFQNTLDNTRNMVWYEDERSIQAKMDIAKYLGVSNFSIWRLGLIPNISNEPYFLDIWGQVITNYE